MRLLETTFWSAGGSRHGMAERLGFSRSKANGLIAGLVEQGLLAEAGL
jgi:DNA-binding IclR family transcriptional regulator